MGTKNVFITGANKNTGRGITKKYAQEGWNVFLSARNETDAQSTANWISSTYGVISKGYAMDSADGESRVREVFCDIEREGHSIDVLVLNAANLGINQEFFTMSVKDLAQVFETNVFWNFCVVKNAVQHMIQKKQGSIVFVNSNTAYRVIPDRLAYQSSKGAVLSMSRALAFDLGKYGIRSNCVLPGMIKTDRWESNYNNCRSALSNYTPIGDIADFEDIANAVYYFGSDCSKNTTGAELVVDGGNMIQLYPLVDAKE